MSSTDSTPPVAALDAAPAHTLYPSRTASAERDLATAPQHASDVRRDFDSALRAIGPNWFASVMGTGILAAAVPLLPVKFAPLTMGARAVWVLALLWFVALTIATALQWWRHREIARAHHRNLSMAPFYGAPPMAMMTLGSGALSLGPSVIGSRPAVIVSGTLWITGTLTGLISTVAITYLMFTLHRPRLDDVYGSWLMPVVPPMVSAATGAALIKHWPAGAPQLDALVACYALFGVSLLFSIGLITLLWARLIFHGVGARQLVPTLWIVLGPLGQSITAAGLLAHAGQTVLVRAGTVSASTSHALSAGAVGASAQTSRALSTTVGSAVTGTELSSSLRTFGIVYGIPVWGFAMVWLAIAALITLRALSYGLPFSLTWWSFTFPLGTLVTGTAVLHTEVGAPPLKYLALALYALLAFNCLIVAARTAHAILRGHLLFGVPLPATPTPSAS